MNAIIYSSTKVFVMNLFSFSFLIIISGFFISMNLFAYIDPGSGGAIITAILGFFAAIGYTLRKYFYKIRNFFIKKNKD